jgi:hypothetical protein
MGTDKRGLVKYVTLWHTQSQRCNNDNEYNDDNVMRASLWFEYFGGLFECRNPWYMRAET